MDVCVVVEQVLDHLEVATTTRGDEGRVSGALVLDVELRRVFSEHVIQLAYVIVKGCLTGGLEERREGGREGRGGRVRKGADRGDERWRGGRRRGEEKRGGLREKRREEGEER